MGDRATLGHARSAGDDHWGSFWGDATLRDFIHRPSSATAL